jgi:hypothetical protein
LEDERVREARRFLRVARRGGGPDELARRWPALSAAYALRVGPPSWRRWMLEVRLLTGEPYDRIAERLVMSADAAKAYHDQFFDVRGRLHARDWICNHILRSGADAGRGEDDLARLLKYFAYHGGPLALDSLVECYVNPPVVPNRPELLGAREFRDLCGRFLVQGALLAQAAPAEEPKVFKQAAVILETVDRIRRAAREVEAAADLTRPLCAELDADGLAATVAAGDVGRRDFVSEPVGGDALQGPRGAAA